MSVDQKKEALYEFVKGFIEREEITCADTIYQRDSLVIEASTFMERCVEIVGYTTHKD